MRVSLGVLLLVFCAGQVQADVIYSTFGPGDSFLLSTSWNVTVTGPQEIAMPFTVGGSDYQFRSIDIAVNNVFPDLQSTLDILLMSDAGGVPGSVIETLTVIAPPDQNIVSGNSVLLPLLEEGVTYWIATDARPGFVGSWPWTDPLLTGPFAFSADFGASWNPYYAELSAFRVNGTAVPEPGTLTLAGLGVVGLVAGVFRRKRGFAA